MNRRLAAIAIGILLAATYGWQIFETATTDGSVRPLHVFGLLLAVGFVALQFGSDSERMD